MLNFSADVDCLVTQADDWLGTRRPVKYPCGPDYGCRQNSGEVECMDFVHTQGQSCRCFSSVVKVFEVTSLRWCTFLSRKVAERGRFRGQRRIEVDDIGVGSLNEERDCKQFERKSTVKLIFDFATEADTLDANLKRQV